MKTLKKPIAWVFCILWHHKIFILLVPAPEDEAMLARALEMSMEPEGSKNSAKAASAEPNLAAMTEEEQIAYAMRMSMQVIVYAY